MKWREWLIETLFPEKCAFCGALTAKDEHCTCRKCRRELPWTGHAVRKTDFVTGMRAPLYYEGTVRRSFIQYKFNGYGGRSVSFGHLIAEEIAQSGIGFDLVTWAPLSARRERRRGYDQARLLAEVVSSALGVECAATLRKTHHTRAQSSIDKAEARRANVSGVYSVIDANLVADRRVLLIDDIITTGATVSECARMLLLAGADSVSAAALAMRRRERDKATE